MKISVNDVLPCRETAEKNQQSCEICEKNLDSLSSSELLSRIDALGFAAYDLQLFLDTHRDCAEALEMYKSLVFSYRAALKTYQSKFAPLSAMNSSEKTPFEWVSDNYTWPWQKEGEM